MMREENWPKLPQEASNKKTYYFIKMDMLLLYRKSKQYKNLKKIKDELNHTLTQ